MPPINDGPTNLQEDLSYVTATRIVDEIPPALNFLDQLMFGPSTEQTLTTEQFEIIVVDDDRSMTPFIKPGTRAPATKGIEYSIGTYMTPMLGESRPIPMAELLLRRRPGQSHYRNDGSNTAAARQHIAREFARLRRRMENRAEWMAAQMLNRTMEYSVDDQSAFTITYPFKASTVFTLAPGTRWNEITYTGGVRDQDSEDATDPAIAFDNAARTMVQESRVPPTHCIMGSDAAAAIYNHPLLQKRLDIEGGKYNTGALDRMTQFSVSGARYLGRFVGGVECWEYSGQLVDDSGNLSTLIDPKDAYWIHVGPMAEFEKVFGVIPNWKAQFGQRPPTTMRQIGNIRAMPGKILADVIPDQHGNMLEGVLYSRPLPVLRRPNVIVHGVGVAA